MTHDDETSQLVHEARAAAAFLAASAGAHDLTGTFPHENFEYLRAHGWPALPVPREYGGRGASLSEVVDATHCLAGGDGSTALALAMHFQTLGDARDRRKWRPELEERLYGEVAERGVLINACASEPDLGSPSRGGLPRTTARRSGDVWRITGRKSFATLAPALDYFVIPAALAGETELPIGRFLVPRSGVVIEGTWDPMGMRATGSHDIALDEVAVPDDHLLYRESASAPDPMRPSSNAWFIALVTAAYLGVAEASVRAAAVFALERRPTALGRPIATLEAVQRRLGVADVRLRAARALLSSATREWDSGNRDDALAELYAAKVFGTNAAIDAAGEVMRVAGGSSVLRTLPLERHFRDVQAGLHHPPSDDAGHALLGRLRLAAEGWEP